MHARINPKNHHTF